MSSLVLLRLLGSSPAANTSPRGKAISNAHLLQRRAAFPLMSFATLLQVGLKIRIRA